MKQVDVACSSIAWHILDVAHIQTCGCSQQVTAWAPWLGTNSVEMNRRRHAAASAAAARIVNSLVNSQSRAEASNRIGWVGEWVAGWLWLSGSLRWDGLGACLRGILCTGSVQSWYSWYSIL
jgi:hypothetical protein